MNNLLERCARAILNARMPMFTWDELDHVPNFVQAKGLKDDARKQAEAAITAICDEIDDGGLDVARYELNKSTVRGDKLENAIRAYFAHIKSTTEIKE